MWDKYRHSSPQTITVIGVLILSSKLALADGTFTDVEREEILRIVPHEIEQRSLLSKIINEAVADPHDIYFHARRLKKLLGDDREDFLEFIVAILVRIAHADHIYDEEEDKQIRKVAEIFGIKASLSDRIIKFFKNIPNYLNKINLKKANA